jgi:hypothetical protein
METLWHRHDWNMNNNVERWRDKKEYDLMLIKWVGKPSCSVFLASQCSIFSFWVGLELFWDGESYDLRSDKVCRRISLWLASIQKGGGVFTFLWPALGQRNSSYYGLPWGGSYEPGNMEGNLKVYITSYHFNVWLYLFLTGAL